MENNRLDIDYNVINKLESITKEIGDCILESNWKRKAKLESLYFEIYDQWDYTHQQYIEDRKGNKYE